MVFDLNCDMGESYGNYSVGQDAELMPYITSCNIACGFHGGDPYHIERTIDLALVHNLRIGAHPSYPDRQGFGRRKMIVPVDELSSLIKYQVGALKVMVESKGGQLSYVKPHGALYNSLAHDLAEAKVVIEAIKDIDNSVQVMLLAGSPAVDLCQDLGMKVIQEGFADRRYDSAIKLMSRSIDGSVITDPHQATEQVIEMATKNEVLCRDGSLQFVSPDSFCIHGDNPMAVEIAKEVHNALSSRGLLAE